jgi:hypothetical protein
MITFQNPGDARLFYRGSKSPCNAPGDKVHQCNYLLRTWSQGLTGTFLNPHVCAQYIMDNVLTKIS